VRITIDASPLLLRSAGVKNYLWHWLRALRRIGGSAAIRAYPFLNTVGALDHERSVLSRFATAPRIAALFATNWGGGLVLDALCQGADIFHASNQVRVAPRYAKATATIHDLTCWLMPELHTEANVRADREFADRVLKRAAGLIAVSENTRQDAIRILGIAPERIQAIHSGVDERYFNALPAKRDRPYFLFVGTIEPRKNIDALLDAWEGLSPGIRDEFDLLIAGPAGWRSERTIARLRSGVKSVRYLGYVAEAELPSLTAGATAVAYVSLYEGFGFPAAQAMAAGVPVIASNTSCLPEIVGEGGLFVDPKSESEIRAALSTLALSPSVRARAAKAGRERAAACFRWEACAKKSLEFFKHVLGT
jgi:alpha-1,3-rhamnosyl/mannosyltransferase